MDKTKMFKELIDEILSSDFVKEFADEKIGKDEYYFSVHTKNLDILGQFDFDQNFLKTHPDLAEYLRDQFKEYVKDEILDDKDTFDNWFSGGESHIHFGDGGVSDLVTNLLCEYRERITETHKCEKCGQEISEKFPYGHSKHLHRIGFQKEGESDYKNKIYCRKCYREETK